MLVLDTNVVSELMRPRPDERVLAWVREQPVATMAITAVTVMEIRYGIACQPEGARKGVLAGKVPTTPRPRFRRPGAALRRARRRGLRRAPGATRGAWAKRSAPRTR